MNVKKAVENQSMIFNILKQSKNHDRLSHAYLFYGDEGVGKKEMAYALACLLYCPNGGCLECDVCQSIIQNHHMNVDYIGMEEAKTMISKEQITSLQEEFSKTSLVEGSRVYIVDGIDTASMAAQNSLLKFIEEPVNSTPTIGIFLATDISNVVSTILSRCAVQHFKALPLDKSIDLLKAEGIEELDAILAASLTNNTEQAKEMALSHDFAKIKSLFLEFTELKKPKDGVLFYLENLNFLGTGKNLSVFLEWILLFLEDANIMGNSRDDLILKPLYDKITIYRNENEKSLKDKLKTVLDLFDKLKYNVSAKNVFHELIVKII
mgnify:CR=1 FL=1